MSNKNRPVLTPPIQRATIPYFLTRVLAKQGVKRFHRLTTIENFNKLPKERNPIIFVSNHQNGMMDPMIISGLIKPQLHWLTRSDVFWNPLVRKILYAYNQMPIYRQRDRFSNIRERNDIIWDCCIERLDLCAALSLFPEGNHNPQKTIRDMKRGLSDLLSLAVKKHSDLKRLKIIPLGLEYEDYPGYRRRLSLRMGDEIEWNDLIDDVTKMVDFRLLSLRVQASLRKIAVDIRPKTSYEEIIPYVRAMRTAEAKKEVWVSKVEEIDRIALRENDEDWIRTVSEVYNKLVEVGYSPESRPEAWGIVKGDVRQKKIWAVLLYPIACLGNLPTVIQQYLLNKRGDKVKAMVFRSTLKVGAGMFVYPISWTILAAIAGTIAAVKGVSLLGVSPFFEAFIAFWSWATFGNRFYGWIQGHLYDHKDAIDGERFWNKGKSTALRDAWIEYIAIMKQEN